MQHKMGLNQNSNVLSALFVLILHVEYVVEIVNMYLRRNNLDLFLMF